MVTDKSISAPFAKIYIEISNICNLQCHFCPTVDRPNAVMSVAQLAEIVPKIRGKAQRYCFHVMGEPLNHPEFDKMVSLAESEQLPLEITTNGTLLNSKNQKSLLNPTIQQVNFSIQSFIDNYPKADPATYFKKIFEFCKKAERERPNLYINLRLWNINSDNQQLLMTQSFIKLIEEYFVISINPNVDPAFRKSKKIRGRIYLHFDTRFDWPHSKNANPRTRGTCHGGQKQMAILTEGTVVPCCFDKEADISLGSIFLESFDDILKKDRYRQLVNGFQKNVLIEDLCQKCSFSRRFDSKIRSTGESPITR